MKPRVAVLGANGFIGSRLVELWHVGAHMVVRPVVRDAPAMALTARFRLEHAFADALNASELTEAFRGCNYAIHAISGTPRTIVESIAPVYRAAEAAGVRRLVYLSSASVHGQAPPHGADEGTPLRVDQPIAYNNAKVRAEHKLLSLRSKGAVEIVILRPGIVYGPRSSWIGGFADELLTGKAYVVNQGRGVCNCIYVDNLAHAIHRALTIPAADRERFLVSDAEEVSWREFYRPIAEAFGIEVDRIRSVHWDGRDLAEADRLSSIRESPYVKRLRPIVPGRVRRTLSRALEGWVDYGAVDSPWALPTDPHPVQPSLERALLHSCSYKLPIDKATRLLGFQPPVSFHEGMARSVSWLEFAGYPVKPSLLGR
jgi:2-alkyl-3-oxoalkanoate reductase